MRIISETKNPEHIDALMDHLDQRFQAFPGMRAFSSRGSIISSNDGGTRAVALNISGPGLPEIYQTAQRVYQDAGKIIDKQVTILAEVEFVSGQFLIYDLRLNFRVMIKS